MFCNTAFQFNSAFVLGDTSAEEATDSVWKEEVKPALCLNKPLVFNNEEDQLFV